jgi:glycosyltransferase involved in cell wall biosynthesis
LDQHIDKGNDEVVILDDLSDSEETKTILSQASYRDYMRLYQHALDRNYGEHKNYGIQQCNGNFIFQLDGDELPPKSLIGKNIHALIDGNPTIEAFVVPRINAWDGLTSEHAKQWGWTLDMSPTYNRLRAAWPDYQWRIFENVSHIRFQKRLHERIDGFKSYAILPAEEEWALYHDKTIETQIKTNQRYNEWFTEEENRGHQGFSN